MDGRLYQITYTVIVWALDDGAAIKTLRSHAVEIINAPDKIVEVDPVNPGLDCDWLNAMPWGRGDDMNCGEVIQEQLREMVREQRKKAI